MYESKLIIQPSLSTVRYIYIVHSIIYIRAEEKREGVEKNDKEDKMAESRKEASI